ncbi:MAG: M56 family metallopeptidase [Solirubrobacterales bacterium]
MTGEMATQCAWVWPLAWQSTICLAAGIGASIILRRRAARAHQILLLAILAAAIIPALARVVKHNQWGLLVAERTVPRHPSGFLPSLHDVAETQIATRTNASDKLIATMQPADAIGSHSGGIGPSQVMLAVWLAAGSTLLLRLAARFTLGLRLASRSEPVHCVLIEHALRRAREKLGVGGGVIIRRSDDVRSPVIWCWNRRPVLLIPRDASEDSSLDWESIICHELAHWKRCDHVSGLLAELLVCILPWQPLLWWGRKRLMDLSEEACDDWVIASGQTGTRYARTLLGLTPQGYAALVPAVVAGKSSLGARVRRIVAGHCGDPRSSLRWTLIVVAVTACLSLGIALAQTRPAPTQTLGTTALDDGAVIEQVASAHILKGQVLDPNGKPIGEDDVRVTVLPATCYVVKPDTEGCFELAWSPDWVGDDRKPRLLARNAARNLVSLVEIPAPPATATIQLEPGLTITGRVVDPNGRPVPKALTMLSLADKFTCQSPLAAAGTNENGEFKIQAVPCGQAYILTVWAEGHVTSTAHLDATNAPTRTFDAETVTLASRLAGKSDSDQSPNPNSEKDFLQTYRLGEGEVLKFIKPPFVPARQDHLINSFLSYGIGSAIENLSCVVSETYGLCAGYRWDGQLTNGPLFSAGWALFPLQRIVNHILEVPDYDVSLPDDMDAVGLQRGDWIVRRTTTAEERLNALEQIIAAELHRSIRFERRFAERDTIVVTGRYAFTPLPDQDPNRLRIFAREDDTSSWWPNEADSLSQFFDTLADGIDVAIENKSEAPVGVIRYTHTAELIKPWGEGIDKEKDLPLLLDNLARQTGLQFKVERRSAPMWFVVETTGASSQGS